MATTSKVWFIALHLALVVEVPARMLERNAELVATLERLHRLTGTTTETARTAVDEVLRGIEHSEDLSRMALLARSMTTGAAQDEGIDSVYWTAFWLCTKRLASRNDARSIQLLQIVSERAELGGGDLMVLRELMEDQSRRSRLPKE